MHFPLELKTFPNMFCFLILQSSQKIKSRIKKLKVKKEKKKKKEPDDALSPSNVTILPVAAVVNSPPRSTGAVESSAPADLAEAPKGSPAPGNQVKKKVVKKPKVVSTLHIG